MADIRQNPNFLDNFARPSYPVYPIDGSWAHIGFGDDLKIRAGGSDGEATCRSSQTVAASYWTGDPALDNDDQEVWGFGVGGGASGIAFRLWLSKDESAGLSSTLDGYRAATLETSGTTNARISRFDNGSLVGTPLVDVTPAPTTNPGYLLFRRNGNDLELWHDTSAGQDGSNFVLLCSATDTTYMTGLHPGLGIDDLSASELLAWDGFGAGPERFRPQIYRIIRGFPSL